MCLSYNPKPSVYNATYILSTSSSNSEGATLPFVVHACRIRRILWSEWYPASSRLGLFFEVNNILPGSQYVFGRDLVLAMQGLMCLTSHSGSFVFWCGGSAAKVKLLDASSHFSANCPSQSSRNTPLCFQWISINY